MTEADWLAASDPWPMIKQMNGRPRKLHLFACACCRRFWQYLPEASQRILLRTEEAADGPRSRVTSNALCGEANAIAAPVNEEFQRMTAPTTEDRLRQAGAKAVCYAAIGEPHGASSYFKELDATEAIAQAELLRDIFGNPFRSMHVEPALLTWNYATVPAIARHIYDDRAFHDLPILADALEDAGCTNADLLDHCRGPGPHVLGCWVVDLLLGKS